MSSPHFILPRFDGFVKSPFPPLAGLRSAQLIFSCDKRALAFLSEGDNELKRTRLLVCFLAGELFAVPYQELDIQAGSERVVWIIS